MNEHEHMPSSSTPCIECHAGLLVLRHITYFTWLGGELITVPNFPAWVCDVCGRRVYDEKAIQWLNMILDPNAGKPSTKPRRTPPLPRPRPGTHHPVSDS
ncbi:MAG TPA: YgiT-type zinc finger protein [Anaerolineales bacterium]|jgi:YgiT-type zinc finger domain-containing protein|nr:hypothetical protein [Anaerolineae bacterium]HRJ59097.1 YgiT-type zinc finger protein [Anaerolineales bacterium]HRK91422.1 YgiT-type zinc finger protein [Anaerolineales bacterium]